MAAAARASWLAELADALDQAEVLVGALAAAGGKHVLPSDLSPMLAAARTEVRFIRLGAAIPTVEIETGGIPTPWPLSADVPLSSGI